MIHTFADTSGLGALGINLEAFIFQFIVFVLTLWLLKKFAYGKIVETLDARRASIEKSLDQAKETAEELEKTRLKTAEMIKQARAEADDIVVTGQKEAAAILELSQEKAAKQAEHIVSDAHAQITSEVDKARAALKKETIELVAMATERIIGEKLDAKKDSKLIEHALSGGRR